MGTQRNASIANSTRQRACAHVPRMPHSSHTRYLITDARYPSQPSPSLPVPSQDRAGPSRPVLSRPPLGGFLGGPSVAVAGANSFPQCAPLQTAHVSIRCHALLPSCDDPHFLLQLKTPIGLPPFATGRSIDRSINHRRSSSSSR